MNVEHVIGYYGVEPHGEMWKVVERVSEDGMYITLPDSYSTKEAARKEAYAFHKKDTELYGSPSNPEVWVKVKDSEVRNVWECPDCNHRVYIEPWFYSESGEPMCSNCDEEMEYIRTEVHKEVGHGRDCKLSQ